jgi:hypothetical protein
LEELTATVLRAQEKTLSVGEGRLFTVWVMFLDMLLVKGEHVLVSTPWKSVVRGSARTH